MTKTLEPMLALPSILSTRRLLGAAAFFIFCIGTNAMASPISSAQYITDKMVIDIARITLDLEAERVKADRDLLQKRTLEVKQWLASVGGDTWYKNYLKQFGAPTTAEELTTATMIGLSEKKLGLYYIRAIPVSPTSMTALSCSAPKFDDNPTLKAFCALGNWNAAMIFNDKESLEKFRLWANWFLKNQTDGKWQWSFDLPSRNQKAPWISGLTQSLGISVLLREYQLSGDKRYLDAATNALKWINKPISEGGIRFKTSRGAWYEEYPDAANPSHILNGHMWALFGIWDYYRVTGSRLAKTMFDDGVSALAAEIHKYDIGYWSVYAQTNRVDTVTGAYQQFIIEQLRVIYAITGETSFEKIADKWADGLANDRLFLNNAAKDFLKANPPLKK